MAANGEVVSNEDLLASVWDANVDPFSSIVRTTVMRLRRKLGEPAVVETVGRHGIQDASAVRARLTTADTMRGWIATSRTSSSSATGSPWDRSGATSPPITRAG